MFGVRRAYKVAAAAIVLVGGGLGIYLQLVQHPTPQRVALRATVKPGLTFAQFVEENCLDPKGCGSYPPELLRMRVVSVATDVSKITGYKGKELLVVWRVGEANGGAPVGERKVRYFRATTSSDQQALQPQWLPLPTRVGRFFVEATLSDPSSERKIAAACTPVFDVSRTTPGGPLRGSGGQGKPYPCS